MPRNVSISRRGSSYGGRRASLVHPCTARDRPAGHACAQSSLPLARACIIPAPQLTFPPYAPHPASAGSLPAAFTPSWHYETLQGMADGAGLPFMEMVRISMIPELIKASCSIMLAWGDATASGSAAGDVVHLRALDWDTGACYRCWRGAPWLLRMPTDRRADAPAATATPLLQVAPSSSSPRC